MRRSFLRLLAVTHNIIGLASALDAGLKSGPAFRLFCSGSSFRIPSKTSFHSDHDNGGQPMNSVKTKDGISPDIVSHLGL